MLTPQEVAEQAFPKSAFGGYNMATVDGFLDELTDDYAALYKENAVLKAKLKVLVDKVEEYRATEDAMRSALLTAQNMASTMVSEAEEKKEALIASAESEARAKVDALHDEIVSEQKRLNLLKEKTCAFVENMRTACEEHLRQLDQLPDLTPEPAEEANAEVEQKNDDTAAVAALGDQIVASYREESSTELPSDEAEKTVSFPIVKPAVEAEPVRDDSTGAFRLADLKFGRNYQGK